MRKIKVLVVDDSVLFRSQIQKALARSTDIEVVGVSSNGKLALEKLQFMSVDLMTLDLEMPTMDGLETIKEMQKAGCKTKVILFSSSGRASCAKTLEALAAGAIDFIPKPMADGSTTPPEERIGNVLVPKITELFAQRKREPVEAPPMEGKSYDWGNFRPEVLVIGASTGGPNALVEFFEKIKEPLPFPVLIAQHMPPLFTASLAERISKISGKVAKEAEHNELVKPNHIYLAPGDFHMRVSGERMHMRVTLDQGPQRNFVRPCIDHLFETAVELYGKNVLGIIFTGMGRDGADGAKEIKRLNGGMLVQNRESSVVYGMPGAVHDLGAFDHEGSPSELAQLVTALARKMRSAYVA